MLTVFFIADCNKKIILPFLACAFLLLPGLFYVLGFNKMIVYNSVISLFYQFKADLVNCRK